MSTKNSEHARIVFDIIRICICGGPLFGTRRRAACAAILVASLSVCAGALAQQVVADPPPMPQTQYHLEPPGMVIEDFVTGLECVWEIVFLPDGRMLFTERPGRIRLVTAEGELRPQPWAEPDSVFHSGGGGMMGLAAHPEFPAQPWIYAMYTLRTADGPENRIVRFRDTGEQGADMQVILDHLPAANTHNGGRIKFGPDGMLYVCIGDTGRARQAQEIDDLRGSILRITAEGEIPADKPWPDSPIWAIGLRNVQGLAFHPQTGALFAADHGPTDRDQLHVIGSGKNYGWPRVMGAAGLDEFEDPLLEWVPSAPPGSLTFHDHEHPSELRGDLLFTTLRSEALIRIRFEDSENPHRPTSKQRWFATEDFGATRMGQADSALGRLRAIAVGPDGAIYIGTSNIDRGRGRIREGDDRIVRVSAQQRQ